MADFRRFPVLLGCCLGVALWADYASAQRWDNAWKTPHRELVALQSGQDEDIDALIRPCVDYSRETFPDAVSRFQAQLPKGAYFLVVVGQPDPYVSKDHQYLIVDSIKGSRIKGRESNEQHERRRRRVTADAGQVADWVIVYPDRPESGNLLRKYALLRQDGLVESACDPQHPEYRHFRLFRASYSFVPPSGPNWQLRGAHVTADGSTYVDMWMQEHGEGPHELNTLATETIGNNYVFNSDQELVDLIAGTEKSAYIETDRHVPLEQSVTAYDGLDARCALSHRSAQDKKALLSASGERGPMIREIMELGCVHSSTDKIYINITYSHRYKPGNRDPGFVEAANDVFQSLAFSSFEFDGDYSKFR